MLDVDGTLVLQRHGLDAWSPPHRIDHRSHVAALLGAGVDRVLHDDGIYVVNVIDGPELRFARAETETLRRVFRHVAVVATPAALDGRASSNVVLVASQQPIDADALRDRVDANGDDDVVVTEDGLDSFVGGASALRDDFAPTDQLLTSTGALAVARE